MSKRCQITYGQPVVDELRADLRAAREENQQLQQRLAELERHAATARADAGLNAADRAALRGRVDAALAALAKMSEPPGNRVHAALSILGGGSGD